MADSTGSCCWEFLDSCTVGDTDTVATNFCLRPHVTIPGNIQADLRVQVIRNGVIDSERFWIKNLGSGPTIDCEGLHVGFVAGDVVFSQDNGPCLLSDVASIDL